MKNYYAILGLTPDTFNNETLKKAYIEKLKAIDSKEVNNSSVALQNYIELNEAYQVLANSEAKQAYDRQLQLGDKAEEKQQLNELLPPEGELFEKIPAIITNAKALLETEADLAILDAQFKFLKICSIAVSNIRYDEEVTLIDNIISDLKIKIEKNEERFKNLESVADELTTAVNHFELVESDKTTKLINGREITREEATLNKEQIFKDKDALEKLISEDKKKLKIANQKQSNTSEFSTIIQGYAKKLETLTEPHRNQIYQKIHENSKEEINGDKDKEIKLIKADYEEKSFEVSNYTTQEDYRSIILSGVDVKNYMDSQCYEKIILEVPTKDAETIKEICNKNSQIKFVSEQTHTNHSGFLFSILQFNITNLNFISSLNDIGISCSNLVDQKDHQEQKQEQTLSSKDFERIDVYIAKYKEPFVPPKNDKKEEPIDLQKKNLLQKNLNPDNNRSMEQPSNENIEIANAFRTFYTAIRAGQTKVFKGADFLKEKSQMEAITLLFEAENSKDPIVKKALELANKYHSTDLNNLSSNNKLFTEIYLTAFENSGFAKSKLHGSTFFRTKTLKTAIKEQTDEALTQDQIDKGKNIKDSRTQKIYNALVPKKG